MSGDEVSLGGEPAGAAMLQRAYGDSGQQPRAETDQERDHQIEPGPPGSLRRLIRRTGILILIVGMFAAVAAWVALLAFGGIWVWNQLPLV